MGTKGILAHAFADILHEMWQGDLPYITPYTFRVRSTLYRLCATLTVSSVAFNNGTRWAVRGDRTTRLARILKFSSGWPARRSQPDFTQADFATDGGEGGRPGEATTTDCQRPGMEDI